MRAGRPSRPRPGLPRTEPRARTTRSFAFGPGASTRFAVAAALGRGPVSHVQPPRQRAGGGREAVAALGVVPEHVPARARGREQHRARPRREGERLGTAASIGPASRTGTSPSKTAASSRRDSPIATTPGAGRRGCGAATGRRPSRGRPRSARRRRRPPSTAARAACTFVAFELSTNRTPSTTRDDLASMLFGREGRDAAAHRIGARHRTRATRPRRPPRRPDTRLDRRRPARGERRSVRTRHQVAVDVADLSRPRAHRAVNQTTGHGAAADTSVASASSRFPTWTSPDALPRMTVAFAST